jgi:hypothetical protein
MPFEKNWFAAQQSEPIIRPATGFVKRGQGQGAGIIFLIHPRGSIHFEILVSLWSNPERASPAVIVFLAIFAK